MRQMSTANKYFIALFIFSMYLISLAQGEEKLQGSAKQPTNTKSLSYDSTRVIPH